MRFIKITISFTSLIPCLILPRELRETTERTPTQLPVTKKCCFLRLLLNQVFLIPKKVDSFPEIVYLSVPKKNALKCDFSCTSANFIVPLQRNPSNRFADIIKKRLLALVLVSRNLVNFIIAQNKKAVNALWDMTIPPQSVHAWTALFGGISYRRGRCLLILAKGCTRAS